MNLTDKIKNLTLGNGNETIRPPVTQIFDETKNPFIYPKYSTLQTQQRRQQVLSRGVNTDRQPTQILLRPILLILSLFVNVILISWLIFDNYDVISEYFMHTLQWDSLKLYLETGSLRSSVLWEDMKRLNLTLFLQEIYVKLNHFTFSVDSDWIVE